MITDEQFARSLRVGQVWRFCGSEPGTWTVVAVRRHGIVVRDEDEQDHVVSFGEMRKQFVARRRGGT